MPKENGLAPTIDFKSAHKTNKLYLHNFLMKNKK